ncbi:phage tail assembly chaperone [Litoreibacter albidus]|nr:phage tail assembly chaperone [Litoreibacter albidus]
MSGFDWPSLLRVGVAGGLRPAEFWALTPAELVVVLGLEAVEKPLNRARLAELERMYSDMKGAP